MERRRFLRTIKQKKEVVASVALMTVGAIGVGAGVILNIHEDAEVRNGAVDAHPRIIEPADQALFTEGIIYTIQDGEGIPKSVSVDEEKLHLLQNSEQQAYAQGSLREREEVWVRQVQSTANTLRREPIVVNNVTLPLRRNHAWWIAMSTSVVLGVGGMGLMDAERRSTSQSSPAVV